MYEKWQSSLHRHLEGTKEQSIDLCRLSNAYCHKEVLFEHQTANVHTYPSLTPHWRQLGFPDPNVVHVLGIWAGFSGHNSSLSLSEDAWCSPCPFCPWKCPQAGKREEGHGMGVQSKYWRLCARLWVQQRPQCLTVCASVFTEWNGTQMFALSTEKLPLKGSSKEQFCCFCRTFISQREDMNENEPCV